MSDFDDDDDELLLNLVRATQGNAREPLHANLAPLVPSNSDLFRAQGEIAILRAQLDSLAALKNAEVKRLRDELEDHKSATASHIDTLKSSLNKMEDEKKFLGNELRTLAGTKRRRVGSDLHSRSAEGFANARGPDTPVFRTQHVVKVPDEWGLFYDHLSRHTITGASRKTLEILSRIGYRENGGLAYRLVKDVILDKLLAWRGKRLDDLVESFCKDLLELLKVSYHHRDVPRMGMPFILALIHGSVNFRILAVSQSLVRFLLRNLSEFPRQLAHLLSLDTEESTYTSGTTPQLKLLDKLSLVLSLDLMESLVVISVQHGPNFNRDLWVLSDWDSTILSVFLPENIERLKIVGQINVVHSVVEMLSASLGEGNFALGDLAVSQVLVNSLIKALFCDIEIKKGFQFYGLNRMVGNNGDLQMALDAISPVPGSSFEEVLLTLPTAVKPKVQDERAKCEQNLNHEKHVLALRARIVTLLELLTAFGGLAYLNSEVNIKSIVRVMSIEQNAMMSMPRSKHISMRLSIIGVIARLLYFVVDEYKNINELIYPETLYEIFVVLMRIAFGLDLLAPEAKRLLREIRVSKKFTGPVFNGWCEERSREVAHIHIGRNITTKGLEALCLAESDFANGFEFPYDSETVEISRELLGLCVNHDEADNLYYNMNPQ